MAEAGLIFLGVILWLATVFLMFIWTSLPPEYRKLLWLELGKTRTVDKKFKPTPTKTKVDIKA
tara:strand:- start:836 stop:1024 length:189 start_codon:yes stop_codon:yes gene_type:complete